MVGALLGTAVGDALGAPFEGRSRAEVARDFGRVDRFVGADSQGCFTDDTEMSIALGESLVRCGGVDAGDCAATYARWFAAPPRRGYGPSASRVLRMLAQGADHRTTGRAVHPEGSFANGGAMRIAPVGLAYRHAPEPMLRAAVEAALLCTHVHPDAVDGATIQALAVAELCRAPAFSAEDVGRLLARLRDASVTDSLRRRMDVVIRGLREGWTDEALLEGVCTPNAFGRQFQIHAAEAAACALWAFATSWAAPEEAVIRAVMLGGDTDTVGAMTGALAGALHGTAWIPARWYAALENDPGIGRDHLIVVARQVARLDLGYGLRE